MRGPIGAERVLVAFFSGRALVRMLPGLLVAGTALGGMVAQGRPEPPVAPPTPCARAGLVDGELRCGSELPGEVASLCPNAGSGRPMLIAAGDALDTAQLCARGGMARGPEHGWARMAPDDLAALRLPVELNRASERELTSLPRVGPVLARRIVEGRPYADVDGLLEVRGIGPVTLSRMRPRVVVMAVSGP